MIKSNVLGSGVNHNCTATINAEGDVEKSNGDMGEPNSDQVQTIGLDDDRRTEKVLHDLGLLQNGLSHIDIATSVQMRRDRDFTDEQTGANNMDPILPPGFEPYISSDHDEFSSSVVPNTQPRIPQIELDQVQNINEDDNENISNWEAEEAVRTWQVGK